MANYVLEILDGDRAGDVLPVSDRTLRIGRKAGNDLVLADEKTSGVHAEVVLEGDRHVLRDLGSTNGTFLDGKRVTEIVLTPGDVVTIGRLRVKFRTEGDASGVAADAGELAVHRLDAGRLKRRGGSLGLLAALVVAGAGVAGYLWWQGRASTTSEAGVGQGRREAVAVAGNKLAPAIASCDGEEGWNLRSAGGGFQPTTRVHTGSGAFEAVRGEAADAADFAVATLQEPLVVFAGRTLTLAAHVRTDGAAQVGLRAVCFAANEQSPFRFRTGTPLAPRTGWERIETVVAVPPGCDRLQVELVAVLGAADAVVGVDDVAVTEAGTAVALDHTLAESRQAAAGTGSAVAVRSVDPDNPATLLQVLPDQVPAALEGLHRAGLAVLSDLGATLAVVPGERSFALEAKGVEALQFVFPADAASGLMVVGEAADAGFASTAAESGFRARGVLLGDRSTRALLQFEAATACSGKLGGGVYRLRVGSSKAELVLGFRSEKAQAAELLRQARQKQEEGQPGKALDVLRELANKWPQDSEVLAQAQGLRASLLAAQGEALRRLQEDYDEAKFFDTRGGFERVATGVDDLVELYGEGNLEEAEATTKLRDEARARLQAIDAALQGSQRTRLEGLAKAFEDAQQPGLAGLVKAYVQRHLGGNQ